MPINSLSSVQHSLLLGLGDASTVDLKARCSGAHPSDAVLKVRVLNVGEAPGFEFPPKHASLRQSELHCRIASGSPACFGCGFFFFSLPDGKDTQLVCRSFSEEIVPDVAVDLGCSREEVSSESDTAIWRCLVTHY